MDDCQLFVRIPTIYIRIPQLDNQSLRKHPDYPPRSTVERMRLALTFGG